MQTSNITPLAADLSIESFSHFRLTSQSRFLRNYTKLHSNEFLALLHDINHIHNLNNTLTRVASLQQSESFDQITGILFLHIDIAKRFMSPSWPVSAAKRKTF